MFDTGVTVDNDGATLFVGEAGRRDGPPILLLHGGLGSRHDFVALAQQLAADYRLIAVDSRGHGRSTLGQAPLSYERLQHDIETVINTLKLEGCSVIGHSDGGIVGLRLAASGQVNLACLVAVGAHWHLPEGDPVRDIYAGVTEDEWRGMFGEQVARYEQENPVPDFTRLFAETTRMWLGLDDAAYPNERVAQIHCPLLVVHGDDDFLVSRKQAFELAERVEGARLLNLPFASHTVLEEQPEAVLPAVQAFLAACGAGG
jgi:valacyclovir hydrolase